MIRHLIVLFYAIVVPLFLCSFAISAQPYMNNERVHSILRAQEYLFNDRFAQADSVYQEYINDRPSDPAGYLFRAGALFALMSDREENFREDQFKHLLDTVEVLTSQVIDTCCAETTAWMYLLRGHTRSYRSLYESRFGSPMVALQYGLSSIDEYEAGLKANCSLIDLYAGIGSYHYWKSAKAGVLKWVGIFKNEKDKGIDELRYAADSSLLHRELARSGLVWIHLDQKAYDSTIALARQLVERYPHGKTFLWPLAQALYRQMNYHQAAEVYEQIRHRLAASPGNYYNVIQCDFHIAKCYNWLSDRPKTGMVASRLEKYYALIPDHTLRRQQAKLIFLKRIAERER